MKIIRRDQQGCRYTTLNEAREYAKIFVPRLMKYALFSPFLFFLRPRARSALLSLSERVNSMNNRVVQCIVMLVINYEDAFPRARCIREMNHFSLRWRPEATLALTHPLILDRGSVKIDAERCIYQGEPSRWENTGARNIWNTEIKNIKVWNDNNIVTSNKKYLS